MTELPDLKQLSGEAKDALILTLWEALQKLQQKRPKKTSKHVSLPPAKGFKAEVKSKDKESGKIREGSLGRAGGGRPLSEPPDQSIESTIKTCSDCGTEIAKADQQLMERYDKIDLPVIAPIVTRVERYGCRCAPCGVPQLAAVPVGMEPGSPFGKRIAVLVTTMRYSHGISYGRMNQRLCDVFGLELSEGAIVNLLSRVKGQLQSEVDGMLAVLGSSRLVRSDETSARVHDKN